MIGSTHSVGRYFCALLGGSVLLSSSWAEPRAETNPTVAVPGILRFETAEHVTYSALLLPPPVLAARANIPRDHVLLVDTSASQSGIYRSRGLALARAICVNLPVGDHVQLIAVDVSSTSLTGGFVELSSKAVTTAFEQLEERVPLGSTNLELSLRAGLAGASADRPRTILYVGDGFSTAKLIQSPAMLKLLGELRQAAIPVNSFAIGPRTDLILLGTLAEHTGGIVVVDELSLNAKPDAQQDLLLTAARDLARAAVVPVFYPESLVTEPAELNLYPSLLPPVRLDRETVLLAKDLDAEQVHVTLSGMFQGRPQVVKWAIKREASTGPLGFLAPAWDMAEASQGLAMPLAGRQMLLRAQRDFEAQVDTLSLEGVRSLHKQDGRRVEEIVKVLQELDPHNADVPPLLKAARGLMVKPIKGSSLQTAKLTKPQANGPLGSPLAMAKSSDKAAGDQSNNAEEKSNPKTESLLDELEAKRRVREEQITIDLRQAIQDAQAVARESFPDSYDILKRQLDTIVAATDISADVRQSLRKLVESAIQKLQNESETYEQRRAALDRRLSQQEAMKKLMDRTERDEERMEQLIDRVRALLIRGYKGNPQAFEDAEAVSRVAVELDPYLGVPNLDVFNSEAAGHLDKSRRLRSERQDKLLALLYQVELSHVPFPDEPPVVWPSPERWQWITENRRKWKSVDLKSYSKKEEKIVRELDKATTFDFTDESLDGVKDTIMERHGFDIVIDKVKLEEESVATDATDITLKVTEISLKNALKLLLDSKSLTYVIENEVMKITTKTDGIGKRPLRVYNVGDLVMPINPLFGRGGSRSGGQVGGGGQFNGGQQGGMGGMGGGMGGGFGGGANGMGGGGFF